MWHHYINSLAPGNFEWNFRHVIFKQILVIDDWGISCEITLTWKPHDLTDDKSTLVQVMAWCCQVTSHYLSQCWPRWEFLMQSKYHYFISLLIHSSGKGHHFQTSYFCLLCTEKYFVLSCSHETEWVCTSQIWHTTKYGWEIQGLEKAPWWFIQHSTCTIAAYRNRRSSGQGRGVFLFWDHWLKAVLNKNMHDI